MLLGTITLFIAVLISCVSAYYSILGLTAIFAGAVLPAILMGTVLEAGKVMVAVWLHQNWHRDRLLKFYLVPALLFLMMLTSVGVFGFLSKAHVDQNVPAGDVQAQVQILDEQIQTQRDNIRADRAALAQMDAAVDQTMSRSSDEKGADRAASLRRSQAKERGSYQKDIASAQHEINRLQEERAPIASQARKVEAEVGPVKYVAALFSSGTPDQDMLERAVRWVIMLIVVVFDPLAIVLILAGITQLGWSRQHSGSHPGSGNKLITIDDLITGITPDSTLPLVSAEPAPVVTVKQTTLEEINQLAHQAVEPQEPVISVTEPDTRLAETEQMLVQVAHEAELVAQYAADREAELQAELAKLQRERDILFQAHSHEMTRADTLAVQLDNLVSEKKLLVQQVDNLVIEKDALAQQLDNLVIESIEQSRIQEPVATPTPQVIPEPEPEPQVIPEPEPQVPPNAGFGTSFPDSPARGDLCLRVDFKPSRLFKWNDVKWIEVNRKITDVFNYNDAYIQFLTEKLKTGEYSLEDLTETEIQQIQHMVGTRNGRI